MKRNIFFILSIFFLVSCSEQTPKAKNEVEPQKEDIENKDISNMAFNELFKNISAEDLTDNVFKLVGKDYTVITAGKEANFNSMTASYGGWGQLFDKPVTWCFLRANRYTLELIKKEHTYTMSYFSDKYKDQVIFLGSKSGRDSEKMKENTLIPVQTPAGDITYKEAKLVIECKLIELTTVNPNDFYIKEGKDFITDAYKEAKDYHKLVFGEITNIWIRK